MEQDYRTLKAVQRDRLRQIAAATDGNEVPARIMTALETMAAFIAEDIRGRVPAATRAAARLHAIDAVGAWIAGAHTVEGQALIAFRGPAPDLATACAVTRASEIDSIHLASTTTPGGIIIPAALVMAALRGETDTAAVTEAIVAGTEAMVRLGAAIGGPGILYRGIWPTYFAVPFGVAAVAARLYELDAGRTANALALALALASAGVGHHNAATTARWFAIGNAARSGSPPPRPRAEVSPRIWGCSTAASCRAPTASPRISLPSPANWGRSSRSIKHRSSRGARRARPWRRPRRCARR